jgi:hypothetical protein
MAESSIFWTTGVAGDGASAYTQTQVTDWLRRTFLSNPATEGVLPNYANGLAVSGTSAPISVASGAAYVYGFPYENTSAVNLAVSTPSIGTTGHRVVLRADWTARTVRIALKSSSDGVATPPTLTQSAGTTWEISLATLTITTGGVITTTDTRAFAHPNIKVSTAMLDDNSVDDTKAGNRVPQFYRRQGGDSADWSVPGTTTQTPAAVRMQSGSARWSGSALLSGTIAVTFPVAFSNKPNIQITVRDQRAIAFAKSITASGFTLEWYSVHTSYTQVDFDWLAIGPE